MNKIDYVYKTNLCYYGDYNLFKKKNANVHRYGNVEGQLGQSSLLQELVKPFAIPNIKGTGCLQCTVQLTVERRGAKLCYNKGFTFLIALFSRCHVLLILGRCNNVLTRRRSPRTLAPSPGR